MFVGHYSASFVAKAFEPRVPLWVLLLAAQLVDVFWVVFVLTGVEKVRLDPSLASNPLDLYSMPLTHSLLGTLAFAAAAGWGVARVPHLGGTRRAGVAVAGAVTAHWILDLLVHRPDLTLWGAPPKLGLGLWNTPLLAQGLELGFLVAGAAFYVVHCRLSARARTGVALLVTLLLVLQLAVVIGPLPHSTNGVVMGLGLVFLFVAWAGARSERWAGAAA